MRHVSFWLTALLALASSGTATAQTDSDTIYAQRMAILSTGGPMDTLYNPREAVTGAKTSLPVATAGQTSIKAEALSAARAYAEASDAQAFIVWHDGKVQDEAYFGGTTVDTQLASKSLSKPMTAMAVGRAIQLGKIRSLDQSVSDFVTEWKGTPKEAMLIRHILDMRTGFLEQGYNSDPKHPWNQSYLSTDHGTYIVNEYPLTHKPGERYGYSNATSDMVALVIERATGRRYAEFIGTELLTPIGAPGGEVWVNRPGGLAHSGCCMLLPARAWLHLAKLLLDDGKVGDKRLLPEGYVRQMATASAQNPHYGLGLWVAGPYQQRRGFGAPEIPGPKVLHSEPYLDKDLFMFDGNSNQTVFISPNTGLIALRMGKNPPKHVDWDNSFLPNTLMRGLVKPVKLEAQK